MDLKNPFALRDGKIIMVEDLSDDERGLACNCISFIALKAMPTG